MIISKINLLQMQNQFKAINGSKSLYQFLRNYSSGSFLQYDKDPGPHFIKREVQTLLKSMTRPDFDRIFKKRAVLKNKLDFKFMTVEQFEDEVKRAAKRAEALLQMPPIVKIDPDVPRILEKDPDLNGFSDHKYVITDISFDVKDIDRTVLIRQPDGTLEHAPLEVRKRMNQIYFPQNGRKIKTPKLFDKENLKSLLERQEYLFILDLACAQFDPYEKEYHEVTSEVYQHINETKQFDVLRSTRHFGPMAFFYAWHKIIDDLLLDNIKRDYLRHAVELILLHHKLHQIDEAADISKKLTEFPDTRNLVQDYIDHMLQSAEENLHKKIDQVVGKSSESFESDKCFVEIIENYTKKHGIKKVQLELALQTFKEENQKKQELNQNLKQQHGIAS